jgi:enamine deaminase RidA (YjgF/YER057c/UK114 family)
MKFLQSKTDFPFSSAVIHGGQVLETVLTGIPVGGTKPVEGGAGAELREIFSQLDAILAEAGLTKRHLCSARLYLEHVNRDVSQVNEQWMKYLGDHPVNRRCYGVDLQAGMLVEAAFVAEFPPG